MARLGHAIVALDGARLPVHLTAATRMMLEGVRNAVTGADAELVSRLLDPSTCDSALDEMGAEGVRFDPLLHNTVNATMVEGGLKINVIPSELHLDLDCRLLPGEEREDLHRELRGVLGDDVELEPLRDNPDMPGPELGPSFEDLCAILREADTSGTPIPYLVSGGTDARHFARLGIRTYGFLPHDFAPGTDYERHMHDADERVPVSSLEFGTRAVHEALRRYRG
jgi:acetylornithine deacetylase/succinyl-diaminopimelate desuccinylase-like protein